MRALALALLATLGPGSLSPGHDVDPYGPEVPLEAPAETEDPCGGGEGWVGDGDDSRGPPRCDGPDADAADDPDGLHEPDWFRSGEGDEA